MRSLYAILISAIIILPTGYTSASSLHDGSELIGKTAPEFILIDYARDIVRLSSFRDKVILLVFWFPTDENSEKALIALKPVWERNKDEEFEIIAIDIKAENPKALMFLSRHDLDYIFLEGILSEAVEEYKIEGTPSFFIIDHEGKVKWFMAGYVAEDEKKIETNLRIVLAE